MIIWSRWGFLVAVIAIGCLLASELLVETAFADNDYYQKHGWPKATALAAAALIIGPLGRYFNRRESKRLLDPETGQEVVVEDKSTFFFIPMEYWAPILIILGIVFGLVES